MCSYLFMSEGYINFHAEQAYTIGRIYFPSATEKRVIYSKFQPAVVVIPMGQETIWRKLQIAFPLAISCNIRHRLRNQSARNRKITTVRPTVSPSKICRTVCILNVLSSLTVFCLLIVVWFQNGRKRQIVLAWLTVCLGVENPQDIILNVVQSCCPLSVKYTGKHQFSSVQFISLLLVCCITARWPITYRAQQK